MYNRYLSTRIFDNYYLNSAMMVAINVLANNNTKYLQDKIKCANKF